MGGGIDRADAFFYGYPQHGKCHFHVFRTIIQTRQYVGMHINIFHAIFLLFFDPGMAQERHTGLIETTLPFYFNFILISFMTNTS